MNYTKAKRAIATAYVLLFLGSVIKISEDYSMKTVLVPVELTDAQYIALEKVSKTGAQDEAQLIASVAVTSAADEVIHKIRDDYMPRGKSIFDMETGDAEYLALVREAEELIEDSKALEQDAEQAVIEMAAQLNDGRLTAASGVIQGPSGRETWYNLDMAGVVDVMRHSGFDAVHYPYDIREDGVKTFGGYVMIAANTSIRPKGTILDTSLGEGMVVDHCAAAEKVFDLIDIAVDW